MGGEWLWVFVGGAAGTGLRYTLSHVIARENEISLFPFTLESDVFPWATLLANVVGSFLVGAIATIPAEVLDHTTRMGLLAGFCGGLTTFSTFSLQTFLMLLEGSPIAALFDLVLSVGLCLLAVVAGYKVGYLFWPIA